MTARWDDIDARLRRWAEWLSGGDGSGYPARNILDPSWMPPDGQPRGSIMHSAPPTDAGETHAIIMADGYLSDTRRATLSAVYLLRMTHTQAAVVLDCSPRTVADRIERIQAALAATLEAKQQTWRPRTRLAA